jgi:hypothetical protein
VELKLKNGQVKFCLIINEICQLFIPGEGVLSDQVSAGLLCTVHSSSSRFRASDDFARAMERGMAGEEMRFEKLLCSHVLLLLDEVKW